MESFRGGDILPSRVIPAPVSPRGVKSAAPASVPPPTATSVLPAMIPVVETGELSVGFV